MHKKIFISLVCLLPAQVWAVSECRQDIFLEVVHGLEAEISGWSDESAEVQSTDFRDYEALWDELEGIATAQMPPNVFENYKKYQRGYQALDRIHNKNKDNERLVKYYACQRKFFNEEIFYALMGRWIDIDEPDCDKPIVTDRVALRYEFSPENFANCATQIGAEGYVNPAETLPTAEREASTVTFKVPNLDISRFIWWLSPDQANREISTDEHSSGNNAQNTDEESTKNWWQHITGFFGVGVREDVYGSQEGQIRTSNVLGTYEIDHDTRDRRAQWENDRNFWVQRGIASGQLLDALKYRYETEMLTIVQESNNSLDKSLTSIQRTCKDQAVVPLVVSDQCWESADNEYEEDDLWSPKDSVN